MRTLGIHTEYFRFEGRERSVKAVQLRPSEQLEADIDRPCLVVFIGVEKDDEDSPESVAAQLADDTLKRARQLDVGTVVVYPYVHLTENPGRPRVALKVLDEVAARLAESVEVVRAPFGWYKAFELSCLGHPLAEWSGRYVPGGKVEGAAQSKVERKPSEFTRYLLVDLDGEVFDVNPETYDQCAVFERHEAVYGLLRQFVSNELGRQESTEQAPKHITYMREHELLDYCDVSEKGHYKWYPKGLLMQRLILDYAAELSREWGAVEMKNPILIRGDHNVVGELMGEFHERDYQVDGGRGICYLRYASDPLGFPFMQNVRFSHKQTPLKVYEEAACFRNEQEGEVSGLKRVRSFTMTDMHAACATVQEARREFETLCSRFADLMNDVIAGGRWVLGWEGTVEFFEQNRDWLIGIGTSMGVPAFFKLMPTMSHYYAIKNEYQFITQDGANIQVSTVQWDVKDGERFDIGYVGEDGRKTPCPVILHASSFGSIERTFCAILENCAVDAAAGLPPMFPLWLSPTQVRIIPVSAQHLPFAADLCDRLSRDRVRADVDDRNETVGKKIRNGEHEWIPYLLVVGDREKDSGRLTVRVREDGAQEQMTTEELIGLIHEKTAGMPFRPVPLPMLLSRRPIFFG
jgi:threonyl-tRNA synthetase